SPVEGLAHAPRAPHRRRQRTEELRRVRAHALQHFLAGHVTLGPGGVLLPREAHRLGERLEQEAEGLGRVAPVLQRQQADLVFDRSRPFSACLLGVTGRAAYPPRRPSPMVPDGAGVQGTLADARSSPGSPAQPPAGTVPSASTSTTRWIRE